MLRRGVAVAPGRVVVVHGTEGSVPRMSSLCFFAGTLSFHTSVYHGQEQDCRQGAGLLSDCSRIVRTGTVYIQNLT